MWHAPEVEGGEVPPRRRSTPGGGVHPVGFLNGVPALTKRPRTHRVSRRSRVASAVVVAIVVSLAGLQLASCDHGLAPPETPPVGAIRAYVTYVGHPNAWPPADSLRDLRFVAMRFVPADTADFLQLNRMVFSQGLKRNVAGDTTIIGNVAPGPFPYSGVAQQFSPDPFAWRPVGLVEENGGLFVVRSGETTDVHVEVDFRSPPKFPPDP